MGQLQTSCTMNTQGEQTLKETDSLRRMSFDGIPSWGRVGSIRGWSHRVVKHKVVPANCCQCVGAAVEPAHALDKVLVLPIPVPAKQEYVVSILNKQLTRLFSVKCGDLHFTQFRVQHNEGAVVTDRRQHGGAGEAKEQSFNCAATHRMRGENPAGGRRSPVCWEGQLVHSASVDGLHVHRLRFQKVRHSHSAQLITWGRMTAVNQNPQRPPMQCLWYLILGWNALPMTMMLFWCGCQATVVGEEFEESRPTEQAQKLHEMCMIKK